MERKPSPNRLCRADPVLCRCHGCGLRTRPGTASPPPEERTAPLVLEMDGGIVVMVRIQGAGPFRFPAGYRRQPHGRVERARGKDRPGTRGFVGPHHPAGRTIRPLATVNEMTAGCVSAVGLRAVVVPAADLEPDSHVDGLIGQDLLFAHVYTLDYERAVLRCHPPGRDPANAVRLPLTVTDGRALVSLPQSRGALSLVPDSGADQLVLFTRAGQPRTRSSRRARSCARGPSPGSGSCGGSWYRRSRSARLSSAITTECWSMPRRPN